MQLISFMIIIGVGGGRGHLDMSMKMRLLPVGMRNRFKVDNGQNIVIILFT